jgi:hypothetical protein
LLAQKDVACWRMPVRYASQRERAPRAAFVSELLVVGELNNSADDVLPF